MPRTAYLIPGRGGKWGGWRRDVRRRFRFRRRRRFRRFRSPGWVAAGGRATHPAGLPAGRPARRYFADPRPRVVPLSWRALKSSEKGFKGPKLTDRVFEKFGSNMEK